MDEIRNTWISKQQPVRVYGHGVLKVPTFIPTVHKTVDMVVNCEKKNPKVCQLVGRVFRRFLVDEVNKDIKLERPV